MDNDSKPAEQRDPQGEFLRPPIENKESRWGLQGKTVWDWLQLLIVPLMLALITVVFTWQQNVRQSELEGERVKEANKIETQRANRKRELEEQRAQAEALQAYLDQMGTLLLEKDLRASTEDNATDDSKEARTLARTLTVLGRLDPSRKTQAMRFLVEAQLVQKVEGRGPIIPLSTADLNGADLIAAVLIDADLIVVDLSGADLRNTILSDADLSGADLSEATTGWILKLTEAKSLEGATMPDGQVLKGPVNPDGPTFEEWLKSRGSGEDGENGGPS